MSAAKPPPRHGTERARLEAPGAAAALSLRPLRAFRWLDVRSLWTSRNDVLARIGGDPTNALRERWIARRPREGDPPFIDRRFVDREAIRFTLVGDTGEGDESQVVAAGAVIELQERSDFLVIASDVVYPAGDVNQYEDKFYAPYGEWTRPIFAVPGNHDWYDELQGFMFHLCGVDPPRERDVRRPFLWRRPRKRGAQALELRNGRPAGRGDPQPGPYFMLDTGPLAIVGIDTGITGLLDREQGKWLRDVSLKLAKPKVLVTGKPLLVDGQYRPGAIESLDQTVDDIVRNPRHGYVAAIGGDIHNYQRYPVELEGGRCLQYLVAGGGGAFMHATHRIPPVELGDVSEPDFRCFPLRGDSLAFYARAVVPALRRLIALAVGLPVVAALVGVAAAVGLARLLDSTASGVAISAVLFGPPLVGGALLLRYALRSGAFGVRQLRGTTLTPEEAAAYIASSSPDLVPTLSAMMKLAPDKEALAKFVAPRAGAGRGVLHRFFSEIFDVDKPPLYKHALHLEADRETLTIRCYAAIGNEERGEPHQLEDEVQIPLTPARALIARPARDPGAPESD